jgi:hypothetical protein
MGIEILIETITWHYGKGEREETGAQGSELR